MMRSYTNVQCFLTVFLLCFVNLEYNAQTLGLFEGDICRKGDRKTADSTCRNIEKCPVAKEELKKNIAPQLCSFKGLTPIVCCPSEKNTSNQITSTTEKPNINKVLKSYSATEMCSEYSELIYRRIKDPILMLNQEDSIVTYCNDPIGLFPNVADAEPLEFPHMALLGYSEKPDISTWECAGSLISNRFVLTAASCENLGNEDEPRFANWARLGELNYLSETDHARPTDYKIIQRIIHPDYTSTLLYHDIALFRLERDVDFSPFVRPICLNTNNKLKPSNSYEMATGWGKTDIALLPSSHLLKVSMNTISAEECNKSVAYLEHENDKLAQGIVDNLMLCAVNSEDGNYICGIGGPIHIKHNSYKCMYSQIGITSYTGLYCGEKHSPTVYTRVTNYISWIEGIVWKKMYN